MDIITTLQAILLGIVEGITEFLPISSTGHLILLIDILQFKAPKGKIFEIVIQLGAILAVCYYYRTRITDIILNFHKDREKRRFVYLIATAFLPAAIIGALAHGFIKSVLFSPTIVATVLVIGGIIIIVIEKIKPQPKYNNTNKFSFKLALAIGLCQTLALIPGTSRAGATIMGALMLGVTRKAAAEFSFFLAIPTMLGATVFDIYKNYNSLDYDAVSLIAIGFITAFIAGLLTVKWLLEYLNKHDFKIFAYYRIALGLAMLAFFYM